MYEFLRKVENVYDKFLDLVASIPATEWQKRNDLERKRWGE